jgi:hypothetical protein
MKKSCDHIKAAYPCEAIIAVDNTLLPLVRRLWDMNIEIIEARLSADRQSINFWFGCAAAAEAFLATVLTDFRCKGTSPPRWLYSRVTGFRMPGGPSWQYAVAVHDTCLATDDWDHHSTCGGFLELRIGIVFPSSELTEIKNAVTLCEELAS